MAALLAPGGVAHSPAFGVIQVCCGLTVVTTNHSIVYLGFETLPGL